MVETNQLTAFSFAVVTLFSVAMLPVSCVTGSSKGSVAVPLPSVPTDSLVEESQRHRDNYVFLKAWRWEYLNEWVQEGEYAHKGEMTIYHDETSGAWLFTSEAYGDTDDMADWVLGLPTGEYITAYRDEGDRKTLIRDTLHIAHETAADTAWRLQEFQSHYMPMGETSVFGQNDYRWPVVVAGEFTLNYIATQEKTTVFLADTAIDFLPVTCFNNRVADAKLPINFSAALPEGKWEVAAETVSAGRRVLHRLLDISDNYYEINLKDYEND